MNVGNFSTSYFILALIPSICYSVVYSLLAQCWKDLPNEPVREQEV